MSTLKKDFLDILSNYQGILHKVNLIYFRNENDRKDNFQEIVYQLWKSFPDLKNRNSMGSWIYAVSINTSISKLKKDQRLEFHAKLPEDVDNTDIIGTITSSENLQLLLDAIYTLDEVDKPIMLLYLEEKSYDEIAEILGISQSKVGARISRAKEKLRKKLSKLNNEKQ